MRNARTRRTNRAHYFIPGDRLLLFRSRDVSNEILPVGDLGGKTKKGWEGESEGGGEGGDKVQEKQLFSITFWIHGANTNCEDLD